MRDLLHEIETWGIELSRDIEPFEAEAIQESILREAREALADTRPDPVATALAALISDIEDTVDCDLQGDDWRCTVQYDKAMLDRAKAALPKAVKA